MTAPVNDNIEGALELVQQPDGTFRAEGSFEGATILGDEYDYIFGPENGPSLRSSYPRSTWHKLTVPDGSTAANYEMTIPEGGNNYASAAVAARYIAGTLTYLSSILPGQGAQTTGALSPGDVVFFHMLSGEETTYVLDVDAGAEPPGPVDPPEPPVQTDPNLTTVVTTSAAIRIVEGVGFGPDREEAATTLRLNDQDSFSLQDFPIVRNSDGSPAASMQRWFRLMFSPPFTLIYGIRFWSEDLNPAPGWHLRYAIAPNFQKPSRSVGLAYADVPTSDPGQDGMGIGSQNFDFDGGTLQTDWIVLQAIFDGPTGDEVMQDPAPHLTFGWVEI